VQEQVAKLEKHVANTAAELAAQQDRADTLTAHMARNSVVWPDGAQSASSEAVASDVGVGGPTPLSPNFARTLATIPGSPSVPVHAQQALTGALLQHHSCRTHHVPDLRSVTAMCNANSKERFAASFLC
jgi:hypothetical protein